MRLPGTRRLVAIATCAAASLAPSGVAHAAATAVRPDVTAQPQLQPSFRPAFGDYVVRCDPSTPVQLSLSAPKGTEIAVGSDPARSGRFDTAVSLAPGRAVRLAIASGSRRRIYSVRCLPSDFPRFTARRTGSPQAGWYVMTPSDTYNYGYASVFDAHGVPVWWMRGDPPPLAAQLLADGNLAWTKQTPDSPVSDLFWERTLDGRIVRTYSTVGSGTNLHDLRVLPGGNALLITYPLHDGVDLRRWGGPENATVLDGEIQELDPQGHLVWAWNTTSHVALAESAHWLRPRTFQSAPLVVDGRPTYDIVHMNSIEPFGNRLVFSARYLDGVYEIDRTTGHILWKLGGTKTRKSLTIVGDPLVAKDFGGQHDARILDGGRILTLYNNAKGRDLPRALEFRIDAKAGTATLIQTIRFPRAGPSRCCGSARKLPGGDWVVSWGHTPWVTEQTASGRPVLTLEFAPGISSYRAEPILPGRVSLGALRRGMDAMAP